MDNIYEDLKRLAEFIGNAWDELMYSFIELFEIAQKVEIPKKKVCAQIKEIKPSKVIMLNKRLDFHYCRNNC